MSLNIRPKSFTTDDPEDTVSEHQGHRQRMRAKFDNFGAAPFEDHELLEMLLYFALPRIDTNLLAHKLIDRFGGIVEVLNADEKELVSIEGIGPNSARLIKTVAAMAGRYIQRNNNVKSAFGSLDTIGEHLIGLFAGESTEKLYLLAFDQKGKLVKECQIASGSNGDVEFSTRFISDVAIKHNSAHVVLAHNHPGGYEYPSKNDIEMTYRAKYILSQIGITLVEHFVISGNKYYPIIKNNSI